jgi:hypothetical protein
MGSRELMVHSDPAAVGAWCREHAVAGSIVVAPSASARRLALSSFADRHGVSLGLAVCSRGRFLSLVESRAGLVTPIAMPGALERGLILEAGRAASVPLFDDHRGDAPAGAVRAVANLVRTLRLNRVSPAQFTEAGGDAHAADAYQRFDDRRRELGFLDDADRVDAIVAAGVPSLSLVLEDPAFPDRVTRDFYMVVIGASSSCHIGVAALDANGGAPAWTATLDPFGFVTSHETSALPSPAMRAIGGVGTQDEIEMVAREILALVQSGAQPVPSGDVLGVAPNVRYLALLHEACSRLGVPVASPRRRETAGVPLVRALIESFRLLADEQEDTVERGLALLATPYVGLSLDDHDRLSRAMLLRGVGSMRSWRRFARGESSRKFIELSNAVAKLSESLEGERSPQELATTLTALALDYGFLSAGRRYNLAAGRDDTLRLDQQGWESLAVAAAELNRALGTLRVERIDARQWLLELEEVLERSTVRADAKAFDGVHLTVAGAGLPSARYVFAVGWREGVFPRRTREAPLLPERVKKALNDGGALLPLVAEHTAQEYERRERIRRAARESLIVSWPSTGEDGDALLPSFYMDDLGIGEKERSERSVGDTTWPLALAATRGERLARATLVARHRSANDAGAELDAVRSTLTLMTDRERRGYDGLMHAAQKIQLPPDVLAETIPLAATMSASQARMVVHCLYEHFGTRRLRLEPLVPPQLDARLIGTIAHAVLNEMGRGGFDPASLNEALERWWTAKIPRELRSDVQVTFELQILRDNLRVLIENERMHFAASGSRAEYFELSFGTNDAGRDPSSLAQGLEVELPHGTTPSYSLLRGSIDRVDIIERDGKRYGIAVDYKSGKGARYGKEMEDMADFQLPIYCEVLPRFGVEPVGAIYLGIASGARFGVVRRDFARAFIPAGETGRVRELDPDDFASFMHDRQHALRNEIARLAHGELVVLPRKDDCGYCDLRPVCRIGTFGAGTAHSDE